jgi:chondroitin AC lyase
MRGCLTGSVPLVSEAYDRMWQEVYYAGPGHEGIQVDNSFHQHGSLLYAGGYGFGFTADVTRFEAFAQGTVFDLPPAKRTILESYVLDGQQWMVRGSMWDFGVTGRELIRKGKSAQGLQVPVSQLAAMPGSRQAEFAAFAARLRGEASAPPLTGNRYYWKSDYMAQQRPGYMFSTRMYSTRTLNTDGFINGENKKSHHLADGATFIARTGREYFDIAPVWDWLRIPGTTIEQNTPLIPREVQHRGKTRFVGGVSDGRYGCAAMDLASGALSAQKAWFYFDNQIVCLGAGINCPTDNPVFTSLNQCLLSGPVRTSSSTSPIPPGNRLEKGVSYVWHDGVGYLFPEPSDVYLRNEPQTGSLHEVGPGSSNPVQMDVFSLWLDHGAQAKEASYAYIVAPDQDVMQTAALSVKHPIEILSNTASLQAVRHRDLNLLEVVFHQPGMVTAGSLTLSVDQPCLLLFQEHQNHVHLAVSNPLAAALAVNVTLNRKVTGANVTDEGVHSEVRLDLPGGQMGGSSVVWEGTWSR